MNDEQDRNGRGMAIRWEEQGEGLPLVLIQGIPTSPALWRHVVPRILDARCLAFEMVGYGASIPEGRGRDISVGRQADYVAAWLARLGIENAVFAGHDLGGVAQIAAVRHPGLCSGLFLTNAIGYDSWPVPAVKALRATAPLVRRLPDVAARQSLRTLMYRSHDNRARAHEALEVHWRPYAQHGGAESLIRQVKLLNVRDTLAVADALPNLRVPARLVWGAADQFLKIKYGKRFAHDLSAPLHPIERGRHFTPEDHPEMVAQEINRLLADVRKQA
jgi:pimeloyl-ACP methyl ester carboxylesterase